MTLEEAKKKLLDIETYFDVRENGGEEAIDTVLKEIKIQEKIIHENNEYFDYIHENWMPKTYVEENYIPKEKVRELYNKSEEEEVDCIIDGAYNFGRIEAFRELLGE